MKQKVPIIHLTHTDIRSDSRILKQINALKNQPFEITAIGVELNENVECAKIDESINIYTLNLKSRNLPSLFKFPKHVFVFFELALRVLPIVKNARPKIIHCHDTIALLIGVLISICWKTKIIYDAHELESNRNGLPKLHQKLVFLVEKFIWKRIDFLITVSSSIERWYLENLGKVNSSVIYNSPEYTNGSNLSNQYLRQKFRIPINKNVFVYVGMLSFGRGVELILEIFEQEINDAHIVFMGYGNLENEVIFKSKQCKNIHFHKSVIHSDVVDIIKSADFGFCLIENVSLSDYFCLPNKLFEYAFAKVPILASNFPEIKRIIEKHSLGETTSLEKHELLFSIRKLIDGRNKYKFQNVEKLSWETQTKVLFRVYSSLN